ncbi:MAG: polysaccharide deacetylase [Nitrospirae bacterium]|nr:MAG: polysaccharide deacetylase [Nitrospirota bacterium]
MEGVARYPDFLTKEQLGEMKKDPLVTFGNHSYSHHRLARKKGDETVKDYLKAFTDDLSKAENRFSKLIGHKPYLYSYPYGEYNSLMMKHLKDKHYIGAFTQDAGSVGHSTDPFMIPRIPLVGGWAEMKKFREFLETEPISVLNTTPAPGVLPSEEIDSIVIQLKDIDLYRNLGIYISEKGWLAVEVDNPSGRVTLKGPIHLTRKVNRIGLAGVNRRSGRRASFFYMVILP